MFNKKKCTEHLRDLVRLPDDGRIEPTGNYRGETHCYAILMDALVRLRKKTGGQRRNGLSPTVLATSL